DQMPAHIDRLVHVRDGSLDQCAQLLGQSLDRGRERGEELLGGWPAAHPRSGCALSLIWHTVSVYYKGCSMRGWGGGRAASRPRTWVTARLGVRSHRLEVEHGHARLVDQCDQRLCAR